MASQVINVSLPPALVAVLDEWTARLHCSRSALVCELLLQATAEEPKWMRDLLADIQRQIDGIRNQQRHD